MRGNESRTLPYYCQVKVVWIWEEKIKGKGHPCTGTEALYRPYGP